MTTLYHLDSSGRYGESVSRKLSKILVDGLKAKHKADVKYRDLNDKMMFVDQTFVDVKGNPDHASENKDDIVVQFSDTLIKEIEDADIIVLGVPMYNFSPPAVVKAWVDLIARPRKTFKYTDNGPVGLLTDKKVYLVVAAGGTKIGSEGDFSTPWLKYCLKFMGITDVEIVAADQVSIKDSNSIEKAEQEIKKIVS